LEDCIFCKIVRGEIPCDKVLENDRVLAFRDIAPKAPVHVVIVPKAHLGDILECADKANGLSINLIEAAAAVARAEGVDATGFRLVVNTGKDGGQSVGHLHFHLLGGAHLADTL